MRTIVFVMFSVAVLASGPVPPLGLDLYRPVPADNPITPEKVALGRRLFHDRRLSKDATLSCAVCHNPATAFAGVRVVGAPGARRNVPTIVNAAYGRSFFWDGRATSLEAQAVEPLLNPREMAMSPVAIRDVLNRDGRYRREFPAVFGREADLADVARAIATYVRTIRSGNSRYDRYRAGDRSALTAEQQRGLALFFGEGRCGACHAGPTLSDDAFHNTGVAFREGEPGDLGRYVVTGRAADRGAFKTPTLRDAARTAPFMHDGSLATLADVVDYYDRGGNRNPGLDGLVRPVGFSADERRALVAFLGALNGTIEEGR